MRKSRKLLEIDREREEKKTVKNVRDILLGPRPDPVTKRPLGRIGREI